MSSPTQSRELYIATIETFTGCVLPLAGIFLVLVATVCSMRPSSVVDMVEFAGKCKLAFSGQSYVFVAYNAVLPLMLLVSQCLSIVYFLTMIPRVSIWHPNLDCPQRWD